MYRVIKLPAIHRIVKHKNPRAMKIGDKVELNQQFRIIEYSEKLKLLSIQLADESRYLIPAQINTLNIHFEVNDFLFPGDHLPVDSPDYFQRVQLDRNTGAVYLSRHNNQECTLALSTNFRYSGEYTVIPVRSRKIHLVKTAKLRSRTEFLNDLAGLLNMDFPGNTLSGRVQRIFSKSTEDYYQIDEEALACNNIDDIIVVFQDMDSEFFFKIKHLMMSQ